MGEVIESNRGGVIDYGGFIQLPTVEDLKRITEQRIKAAEAAIPELREHWCNLLVKRPYSVGELVGSLPQHLQDVRYYALPSGLEEAVRKVFEGDASVELRYDNGGNAYCGLSSSARLAQPHK